MTRTMYVLRGVDLHGDTHYYTGRTGDGWVSTDPSEAVEYTSHLAARSRACAFNRGTALNGIWFVPVVSNA